MDKSEWFQWVLACFVGLLTWFGKSIHKKASAAVTRSELRAYIKESREERQLMHAENKATLERIHNRVDELYKHIDFR
jgi:hypothetical protein